MMIPARLIGGFVAAVTMALFVAAPAAADLLVTPTNLVFDHRERGATLQLVNTGSIERTYRIEWRDMDAAAGGEFTPAPAGEARRLADFVRFSPRQVTLAPGEQQSVRLLADTPGDLTSGSYRSYLRFAAQRAAPEALAAVETEGATGLRVDLAISVRVPVTLHNRTSP